MDKKGLSFIEKATLSADKKTKKFISSLAHTKEIGTSQSGIAFKQNPFRLGPDFKAPIFNTKK